MLEVIYKLCAYYLHDGTLKSRKVTALAAIRVKFLLARCDRISFAILYATAGTSKYDHNTVLAVHVIGYCTPLGGILSIEKDYLLNVRLGQVHNSGVHNHSFSFNRNTRFGHTENTSFNINCIIL